MAADMRVGASVGPLIEEIPEVDESFDFVEIAIGEMEVPPEEVDREQLREDLEEKELGLTVHLPLRQPLVTSVSEFNNSEIEYLERMLEFCSELDAEKAVIHLNKRHGEERDNILEQLRRQVSRLERVSDRTGVEVVYKNIASEEVRAVELSELGEFAEEMDIPICLDTGHAYAEAGQEGLNEFLEEHLDMVSHLHIQDSMDREDSHVTVGQGDIDWEEVGERLSGFDGTATIEVVSQHRDYQRISRRKLEEVLEEG